MVRLSYCNNLKTEITVKRLKVMKVEPFDNEAEKMRNISSPFFDHEGVGDRKN